MDDLSSRSEDHQLDSFIRKRGKRPGGKHPHAGAKDDGCYDTWILPRSLVFIAALMNIPFLLFTCFYSPSSIFQYHFNLMNCDWLQCNDRPDWMAESMFASCSITGGDGNETGTRTRGEREQPEEKEAIVNWTSVWTVRLIIGKAPAQHWDVIIKRQLVAMRRGLSVNKDLRFFYLHLSKYELCWKYLQQSNQVFNYLIFV